MPGNKISLGLAATAAALVFASAATAQPRSPAPPRPDQCFFLSQWRGWSAPDPHTVYLAVNFNNIWRLDLAGDAPDLVWGDAKLVNVSRGVSTVCSPLDLDLRVVSLGGVSEPLFIKSMRKLTPEEVKAIPPKDRPQ